MENFHILWRKNVTKIFHKTWFIMQFESRLLIITSIILISNICQREKTIYVVSFHNHFPFKTRKLFKHDTCIPKHSTVGKKQFTFHFLMTASLEKSENNSATADVYQNIWKYEKIIHYAFFNQYYFKARKLFNHNSCIPEH